MIAAFCWGFIVAFVAYHGAQGIREGRLEHRRLRAAHEARVREYERRHPRLPERFTVITAWGPWTFTNKGARTVDQTVGRMTGGEISDERESY